MKLDSKYFDKVRIKPAKERKAAESMPGCEWPGCTLAGNHRAPKGRADEGAYHRFCTNHVQQYNKSYNFFDGMPDAAVTDWLKESATGHRPTWKLGQNSAATHNDETRAKSGRPKRGQTRVDPFGMFGGPGKSPDPADAQRRNIRNGEVKALYTLGLDEHASPDQAKTQYKTLVKRLHPDANAGSRANEDTLRAVIQAFDYLRSTGFVD